MADIPHLAWPLRMGGSSLATVEQDTIEDVEQCVHALLATPRGARPLSPDVGFDDPTFVGVDAYPLAADLMEQEPRAAVRVDVTGPDRYGVQGIVVHVDLAGDDEPDVIEEEEAE